MKKIILVFLISIILFSCKKDYLLEAFILTDDELQYIQNFSDKEISFVNSSNGEVLVFPATLITTTTERQYKGLNMTYYYNFEVSVLPLASTNIKLYLTLNSIDEYYGKKPYLLISWSQIDSNFPGVVGSAYIPMDSTDLGNKLIQYDSLTVYNKVYYNVFKGSLKIGGNDTIFEPTTYPIEYFFDKQYGIIKFNMSDSTSLERVVSE